MGRCELVSRIQNEFFKAESKPCRVGVWGLWATITDDTTLTWSHGRRRERPVCCPGEIAVLIACAAVSDRARDAPYTLNARGAAHVLERLALLLHGVHPLGDSLQLTLSD